MGAIAIWCMHFIGMRAIVLKNGEPELQIFYSPGVTAASFFLPILALIVPLCASGISENVSGMRIVLSGTLTGFTICGMHYLAQAGIANYTNLYHPAYVVGSATVAVIASIAALGTFFYLRAAWTDSWWKRLLCALLLSAGVSGMHWLGTVGTEYKLKDVGSSPTDKLSRGATVVVVLVLSISTCILLLTIAIIARSQVLQNADKAKQIVLASATFDYSGRIMVKPEGSLPSQTITDSYTEDSLEEIFGVSHEAFRWIFCVTHNWPAVADLIPGMRSHMRAMTAQETNDHDAQFMKAGNMDIKNDFSWDFKKLFCVAAQDLAEQIHESLTDIGVLYDDIMNTGTTESKRASRLSFLSSKDGTSPDVELGKTDFSFGRGQLLFVVRLANKVEAARLQASGFRFADVQTIADSMARRMQVAREELLTYIEGMREYSKQDRVIEPGLHTACFAIRPSVVRSFDILVRKTATNLLPSIPMQLDDLEPSQLDLLRHMGGWTAVACLAWLSGQRSVTRGSERIFVSKFFDSLSALAAHIEHPSFLEARLVGHPISVPSQGMKNQGFPGIVKILAFHMIVDIHTSWPIPRMKFSPYNFFKCQQNVWNNTAAQGVFASKVRREFGPGLDVGTSPYNPTARFSMHSSPNLGRNFSKRNTLSRHISRSWRYSGKSASLNDMRGDDSSEKDLVQAVATDADGDISVIRDSHLALSEIGSASDPDIELRRLSNRRQSTVPVAKGQTFCDELFAITVNSSRR